MPKSTATGSGSLLGSYGSGRWVAMAAADHLATRVGSGLWLTEAGERLGQLANHVLDELARAVIDATRIGRGVGSVVRLGVGVYCSWNWLPRLVGAIFARYPQAKLEIVGEATHLPLTHLRDKAANILLMPALIPQRGIIALLDLQDEWVCVVAPGHSLVGVRASRPSICAMRRLCPIVPRSCPALNTKPLSAPASGKRWRKPWRIGGC